MQSNWTHRQIGKDKISARQRSKADSAGLVSFQIRYTAPDPTIRDVEGRLGQTRREATVRATDIEAALDEAQRLHADQAGRPITGAAGQTVGQFLTEWMSTARDRRRSASRTRARPD